MNWKQEEEKRSHTKFVRPHGKYTRHDSAEVHQFYCHRSGYYNPEGKGIRKLKSQGSCKMGAVCPATITAYKLPSGLVDVKYFSTHVGHLTDLEELYFTHEERAKVNSLVSRGVVFSSILDQVRNSLCGELDVLIQFIHKDLQDVDRGYCIWPHPKFSQEDLISATALIDELMALGADNPIIYNKMPWSENGALCVDDLVVIVMTSTQAKILQKFGDGGIVCFDTVTGEGGNDPALVSLSTVDDDGQAYPCAFCLCNKVDVVVLSVFFSQIKKLVGCLKVKYFMTGDFFTVGDEGDVSYMTWTKFMGAPQKRLFSSWQIDKEWRKHLSKIAGKPYQKATVYKAMRVLLKEPDPKKFNLLMTALLKHLLEGKYTEPYGKYLELYWANRCQQWAFCYRSEDCVKWDLELEAMNMVVKHIYPQGKVRRVDIMFEVLLRFIRNKNLHWIVKYAPDQCSARSAFIRCQHHNGVSLTVKNVVPYEVCKWIVRSQQGEFLVEQTLEKCTEDCLLRCSPCNMCVHTFNCSCMDNIVRGTICKHMHLVGRFLDGVISEIEADGGQEFIILTDETVGLSQEVLEQIATATVDNINLNKRVEDMVNEIVAFSHQISINVKDITDYQVLKQIREGLKKIVELSSTASLTPSDVNGVICVPVQDVQSILGT